VLKAKAPIYLICVGAYSRANLQALPRTVACAIAFLATEVEVNCHADRHAV